MQFIFGESDVISQRSFIMIKWLLSAVSISLTLALVFMLETSA